MCRVTVVWHALLCASMMAGWAWLWKQGLMGPLLASKFTIWNWCVVSLHFVLSCWGGVSLCLNSRREGGGVNSPSEGLVAKTFHLSFASSTTMTVIFWSLFLFDKRLIIPDTFTEDVLPLGLNLLLHLWPLAALLLDLAAVPHPPGPLGQQLIWITVYAFGHSASQVGEFLATGGWPYPFMKYFSAGHYVGLIVVGAALAVGGLMLSRMLASARASLAEKGHNKAS